MYGNMTREEMIQRLYEGNFTTGELERQLIAKLFEQCCGGGGSSSGGGVFVVHVEDQDEATGRDRLDKTAAEILEASKTMPVMIVNISEDEGSTEVRILYMGGVSKESNDYIFGFYYNESTGDGIGAEVYCEQYRAANDDDYPLRYTLGDGGGNLQ